jgi:GldM C-terminal domain
MKKSLISLAFLSFLSLNAVFSASFEKPLPRSLFLKSGGGPINVALFKSYQGVIAVLPQFEFDAKCDIMSYQIVVLQRRSDPITINNTGWKFNDQAKAIFNNLKAGDMVSFLDIKTMCPSDKNTRNLGSLSFILK